MVVILFIIVAQDGNEKQRLKEVYAKNEKVYQEMLQVAFNPNDIFKKKTQTIDKEQEKVENKQMVVYKEPIIKRIFDSILRFLHLQ